MRLDFRFGAPGPTGEHPSISSQRSGSDRGLAAEGVPGSSSTFRWRGGLNYAIEAMPDKEERIVARRLGEHELNMQRVVAGVKELAESNGASS